MIQNVHGPYTAYILGFAIRASSECLSHITPLHELSTLCSFLHERAF